MPDAQARIARLAGNLCVTAGAGAGKTRCLVQAYLGLLAGTQGRPPLMPESIVAITFTEKAALEMRARVAAAVAERARAAAPGPDWAALLARVEWSPISTIHSFCAQILREFGPRLGLDPEFAVLDQDAWDELKAEVLAESLRERLRANDERLLRLLKVHSLAGPGGVAGVLSGILAGLATLGLGAAKALAATMVAHDQALASAPVLAAKVAAAAAELCAAVVVAKFNKKPQYFDNALQLQAFFDENPGRLVRDGAPDPTAVGTVLGLLGGNWGRFKDLKDAARQPAEALAELAAVPEAKARALDLLGLAAEVEAALETELARRGGLSFDHLLLKTLALLENHPDSLATLRGRLGALLVDEYQDVNPVQGRIIHRLAGLEGGADEGERPLTLLVGDRKQSIYAFRGADLAEFGQLMEKFQAGHGGTLEVLERNYRSTAELVDFFNCVFQKIFDDQPNQKATRNLFVEFTEADVQTVGGAPRQGRGPAVEVLDLRPDDSEATRLPLETWRRREAAALADHLGDLLAAGWAPGDIVLLFRRLSQVQIYEEALRAAGLNFYTVRGRGFYACREVADLLLGLRALLDPADDLALAGWLRSPLVGLSDEALLALAYPEPTHGVGLNHALAQGAGLPAWLGPEQAGRWAAARARLAWLRPLARRLPPAELIEALIEASDLIPVLLGLADGEQRVANLRKLIETAREHEAAGRGGAAGFCRELGRLVAEPPADPQAPLAGEGASVLRLMTIHQAKGLQFPVVVLPDLDSKPPAGSGPTGLAPGGVLAAKAWDIATAKWRPTPLSQDLKRREDSIQAAESARLFYVACTRAEAKLIFCLHGGEAKGYPGRWRPWLENAVLTDPATVVVRPAGRLAGAAQAGQSAPALGPDWLPAGPGPAAETGAALARACLARPSLALGRVRESVSGLEDWLACPRRWWFTRRLGLDTAVLAGAGGGAGQGRAAELGSDVHALLERADLWAGPEALAPALAALNLAPDQAREVHRRAAAAWTTPLADLLAQSRPGQAWRELPFSLLLPCGPAGPELEIIGEIDLLLITDAGETWLVDYKVSAQAEPEKYRAQMALYALALWRGADEQGPPPRAGLCFLGPRSAQWHELTFTPAELRAWRTRLEEAGREIASLPGEMEPTDLPAGADCRGGRACPLAAHGLCTPPLAEAPA
ncbi:MAG: UvrD-helicase domain-containing protein [Thermodesulfobacteriota bacterium]